MKVNSHEKEKRRWENPNSHHFEVLSSLILQSNNKPFLDQMCDEKWVLYHSQWQLDQWLDREEAPRHFPKPNLHQQKGDAHCSAGCCQFDPLQLSEFWEGHCIWKVCWANRWDASKTATPTAGFRQQKGPNSSPHRCPTLHTTNTLKVEWIRLWSFASSPYSPFTDYHFFK